MNGRGGIRRREFLQGGVAATLGAAGLPLSSRAASPGVRSYRRLGRTGLEISDISFGSSRTTDPRIVEHAFDRGINYFDTAESYRGGAAENAIGKALGGGKREEVTLASKVAARRRTSADELMHALEGSLRRLQTDRIEIYFNHAVNDAGRLDNPEWYEFAERAKKQGKIRFTGMSGHGGRLAECLEHALDGDLVDVILVAYNFGQDPRFYEAFMRRFDLVAIQPELPALLEKARASDVGVVAMKTLMGARLNDMRPYERNGSTFSQAAFRWVLSNPNVDSLIVSMKRTADIDEFLVASGSGSLSGADVGLLERYARRNGSHYCRPGCDACSGSCPYGVAISEVLRTRMYATDYGDVDYALEDYARLGAGANACATCAEQPCLGSCPYGLPIAELTRSAHQRLARG
ncbi:MAG: aldo/keto reductase [Myxococcota bacterium]